MCQLLEISIYCWVFLIFWMRLTSFQQFSLSLTKILFIQGKMKIDLTDVDNWKEFLIIIFHWTSNCCNLLSATYLSQYWEDSQSYVGEGEIIIPQYRAPGNSPLLPVSSSFLDLDLGLWVPFQQKLEYPSSSGLRKFYKHSLLCPYANLLDHTVLEHCWSYQHTSDWTYQDIVRENLSAAFQQEKELLMNTLAQPRKERPK